MLIHIDIRCKSPFGAKFHLLISTNKKTGRIKKDSTCPINKPTKIDSENKTQTESSNL